MQVGHQNLWHFSEAVSASIYFIWDLHAVASSNQSLIQWIKENLRESI